MNSIDKYIKYLHLEIRRCDEIVEAYKNRRIAYEQAAFKAEEALDELKKNMEKNNEQY